MSAVDQLRAFTALAHTVDADRPTRLGEWRVVELVGHLVSGMDAIAEYLSAAPGKRADLDTVEWVRRCAGVAPSIDERARAVVDPLARIDEACEAAAHAIAAAPTGFVVAARFGTMTLADYIASRCVEACVHTLDLADAAGVDITLDREAEATAVRLLAGAFAAIVPGKSVELRVPPHAAVQCVEGPRHTRGTPPNVVEMDPRTWLELATGRVSWADALDQSRVRASGERADLSAWLPILA